MRRMATKINRKAELPLLEVTGQNFADAVPGDQCYCTIGQALHVSLGAIITAIGLDSADPTSIRVFPAEVDRNPCAGFAFIGTKDGEDFKVEALLEDNTAFKIAQLTDAQKAAPMRRHAQHRPYLLRPTHLRVRTLQGPVRVERNKNNPNAYLSAKASSAAQEGKSEEEAKEILTRRLANSDLPFKLTPELEVAARNMAAERFHSKGSRNLPRKPPVRVYRDRRFYGD